MGLNSFAQLNIGFAEIASELRDALEEDLRFLFKEHKSVLLEFKRTVYTHYINEQLYIECKSIQLGDDGSLTFQTVEHLNGTINECDDVLECMNAGAYFELLLGINEVGFTIK